jgi:hypothetical protein
MAKKRGAKTVYFFPDCGRMKTIKELMEDPRCDVSPQTLLQRLKRGVPVAKALVKKDGDTRGKYKAFGETGTLFYFYNKFAKGKIKYSTFCQRVRSGLSIEDAISVKRIGVGPSDRTRLLSMATAYARGKTLAEIGMQYGISRQRVHQLFSALRKAQ